MEYMWGGKFSQNISRFSYRGCLPKQFDSKTFTVLKVRTMYSIKFNEDYGKAMVLFSSVIRNSNRFF